MNVFTVLAVISAGLLINSIVGFVASGDSRFLVCGIGSAVLAALNANDAMKCRQAMEDGQ